MEKRIHGFDALRGTCALAVAVYHLLLWQGIDDLGALGTYSVNIFFVLSGASIYMAYAGRMATDMRMPTFIGRRLFRLAPLYCLLVLLKGALYWLLVTTQGATFERTPQMLLNLSFLFGFANPGATSILTGGWSLGIEFVFYCLFPLFLVAMQGKWLPYVWMALLLWIQVTFIGSIIQENGDVGKHWGTYVQFVSFVAYFCGGCLIGKIMRASPKRLPQPAAWLGFLILFGLLGFLTSQGDDMALTGAYGAMLALMCVAVVWLSGHLAIPASCVWIATALGNMSYGLYLLHPNIYGVITRFIRPGETGGMLPVIYVIILSAILALLLERYYERKVRYYGYAWLAKPKQHSAV